MHYIIMVKNGEIGCSDNGTMPISDKLYGPIKTPKLAKELIKKNHLDCAFIVTEEEYNKAVDYKETFFKNDSRTYGAKLADAFFKLYSHKMV